MQTLLSKKIADLWNEEITAYLDSFDEGEAESHEGNDSGLEKMEDIETTQTNPEPENKAWRKILKRKE